MKARHQFQTDAEYADYLRTYFAAMAMQGLLAAEADNEDGYNIHSIAADAVAIADALIEALNAKD